MNKVKKATTQKGRRYLEKRAPKLIENDKQTIFVRGGNTSGQITTCLKDLYQLKKPVSSCLKSRNPFHPFEDESGLEKFSTKYDSSLFAFGSHSKKRPNNLLLGRLYDGHIFDMFETGIENFKSIHDFKSATVQMGVKPILSFSGDGFQQDETLKRFKNFLIDFFRCENPEKIRLQGMELLVSFTAVQNRIVTKTYKIVLKKSGCRIPRVELDEMGPCFDMVLRRQKLASDDLYKQATRVAKAVQIKKVKNISHDVFGSKLARVHVKQQDLKTLQTRKMKGLKRSFKSYTDQKYGAVGAVKKSRFSNYTDEKYGPVGQAKRGKFGNENLR